MAKIYRKWLQDGAFIWTDGDGVTIEAPSEYYDCVQSVKICEGEKADHTIFTGVNSTIPAGLKNVTIKRTGGNVSIDGFILDGQFPTISFGASEIDRSIGCLPEIIPSGGTWQWIGIDVIE